MKKSKVTVADLTRRAFLRRSFYSSMYVYGALSVLPKFFNLESKNALAAEAYDCIILGAGMAGISAARNLSNPVDYGPYQSKDNRPLRTLVLEGSDRIGGRMKSEYGHLTNPGYTDRALELGAEYIHREKDSVPLWEEVEAFNLKTKSLSKVGDGKMFHTSFEDRVETLTSAGMSVGIFTAANLLSNVGSHQGADISAAEWLERHQSTYDTELASDFAKMALIGHLPGSLNDISMSGFRSDTHVVQMDESKEYYVRSGYGSIVHKMAEGLDIKLNQIVDSIEYGKYGVQVKTRDGKSYFAKTAICTFSIGMLKSNKVDFQPKLPAAKIDALRAIKMGPITKVSLQFKEHFWPADMSMLHRSDQKRRVGRTYFNLFSDEKNAPAMLNALILGDDAKKVDVMQDMDIVRAICADLDEMYPEVAPTISRLEQKADGSPWYLRMSWSQDDFALGGNSYLSTEPTNFVSVTEARSVLADPQTTPALFWAGEACSTDTQPCSVHGAHSTGIRAAYQVRSHILEGSTPSLEETAQLYQEWYEMKNPPEEEFEDSD